MFTRYRVRMQQGRGQLLGWLVVAAIGQLVGFEVIRRWFVETERGQMLDTAALSGNSIGWHRIEPLVQTVLGAMTALAVLLSIAAVVVALVRRRFLLAGVVTLLIVGANITTQVIKLGLHRPDLGVDLARVSAGNSLPSGHTTVAASVAVALVLVLPAWARGATAVAGAVATALVGVSTLSADWHRPSDVVAALLIVGLWATLGGIILVLGESPENAPPAGPPHRAALALLAGVGGLLLVVALAALALTDRAVAEVGELSARRELFVAYAGGAAGITSAACLVMAMVLTTVHRVVPGPLLNVGSGRADLGPSIG